MRGRGCDPDEDPGRWIPGSGPLWEHPARDGVGYSHAWLGDDLVLTPAQQRAEDAHRERAIRERRSGKRKFGFE